MAYQIQFSRAIREQIRRLPGHIKAIAKQEIAVLSDNPRPTHSKELEGHPGYYRLWISRNYRLVWSINDEDMIVEVHYVGPKTNELYAFLGLDRPSASDE